MRRLLSLIVLIACFWLSLRMYAASDVFFAPAATGSGNGSSCANAFAFNDATHGWNAAVNWVAGTTLHICGTITMAGGANGIVAAGNGSAGNPITVKFETNAVLQAPWWGTAISLGNHNFITVDGGTNGLIQATANGTNLANQQSTSTGVGMAGNNVTVQNLTIANLYVHACTSPPTSFPPTTCPDENGSNVTAIFSGSGSNITVKNCTIHDVRWGIFTSMGGVSVSNIVISGNTVFNANHGVFTTDGSAGGTTNGLYVHDNTIHDGANWDDNADNYHHDGIHLDLTQASTSATNVFAYNNYVYGNWGANVNAWIFLSSNTNPYSATVYNNVLVDGRGPAHQGCGMLCTLTGVTVAAYNNTILSPVGSVVGFNFFGHGTVFLNNIDNTMTEALANGSFTGSWTNIDFNDYFQIGSQGWDGTTFANWQTFGSPNFPDHHSFPTSNPNLSAGFIPNSGSPVIAAGTNLISLTGCNTGADPGIGPLCRDKAGVARSPIGNWDMGAFQSVPTIPPAAPTSLNATVSGGTASFTWTASTGTPIPTAYTLYRGTVHGGPYTAVKSGITGTSTTDAPANGTYFYVVTAFVGAVVSTVSGSGATATVTCTSTCSFPSGTTFTIAGNSATSFNGTFSSTGQVTSSSFTFASLSTAIGSGGGVWQPASESAKSNEVMATIPAVLTASLAPASRVFASTTVGSNSPMQQFTFTNTSGPGGTVTISSISYTGPNPGDFSQTNNCPASLASGLSCTITGTFSPTAPGARSATLSVVDNATGSPQTSAVSGTGIAAAPIVTLNPTSLNFGQQTVSTTSTARSIVLTNTGTGTLSISSVVASGDFAATTVPVTNCGGTLSPLATCSINVTFTPTLSGGRTGAITITDNAAGSPHVANLQGTGITTQCAITGNVTLSGQSVVCGP